MNITKQKLIEMRACSRGIETFETQFPNGTSLSEAVEWCISTEDGDNMGYASWLLTHLFDKSQSVKYAVFAAEQVIGLFEKKYPADTRPREAIEAAKAWLDNPCTETKTSYAAAYAARAAYAADASYAARASYASYAARAADASYAAYAAAYAARAAYAADASYAADAAANAAANAAADAADRLEMKRNILRYGLALFN